MSLTVYYILFATIMLAGAISTVLIGFSKKNREGNPKYDTKTKGNWSRLSWIYIIVIIVSYAALVWYIVQIA